ncbi:molybdate ABC transporter permease [Microbacterium sorbitolivorans]|nr:ABC transporter permease [Microbacterium sorbitolivorans]GGF39731.1 molybdate ABC transporter permease [Microbacterium sorbitolivorans]
MIPTASPAAPPRSLVIPTAIALAFLVLPLVALVARVDWATLPADITSTAALDALGLSLLTATAATICCIVFGIPLALAMARAQPRTATIARVLVTIPLVLPPMVGGVALLFLLGRSSPLGAWLDSLGLGLPFTTPAVVIAQVFVAMPFLVISVEGAVRAAGTDYERAAVSLGAGRWRVLFRVTLPLVADGIVAGVVLSFARAIGEFGATALFAGNAPGVTQTMPLAIYTAFNGSGVARGPAVALSLMLLATVLVVLLLVRAWRPERAR